MISAKSNISDAIRQLKTLTAGPKSIYNVAGSQLRSAILDEFKTLVRETPQYSGSTAASWKIGFSSLVDRSAVMLPKPPSVNEALSKGTEGPCQIAIGNSGLYMSPNLKEYARQDIMLYNEAPGFDTAEEGPVRYVNTPPGALKRFEARIDTIEILVDFPKI